MGLHLSNSNKIITKKILIPSLIVADLGITEYLFFIIENPITLINISCYSNSIITNINGVFIRGNFTNFIAKYDLYPNLKEKTSNIFTFNNKGNSILKNDDLIIYASSNPTVFDDLYIYLTYMIL